MRNLIVWGRAVPLSFVLATAIGCGGGVMKSYSAKEARTSYVADNGATCDESKAKSEFVREVTPRPDKVDYLAIFKVTGCGAERQYLCGNYLCDEGNYCNTYKCEPAK